MRLLCGRVFHILKLMLQHEWSLVVLLTKMLWKYLTIIDWASDAVLFYSICHCGRIGTGITWSEVKRQICFVLLVSKFLHAVECSCETEETIYKSWCASVFLCLLNMKRSKYVRLLQEVVVWSCLVILGVVHW